MEGKGMDLHLDRDPTVQGLARALFAAPGATGPVRAARWHGSALDEGLWASSANAGLLGVALPEEHGGGGRGLAALATVLEEQGRRTAPVPLWSATVAALAVARHGSHVQRADLLDPASAGAVRLTVALEERGLGPSAVPSAVPSTPRTAATPTGTRWLLSGAKAVVPAYDGADYALVSAATPDGPGLFLVVADSDGVAWRPARASGGALAGELLLDEAVGQPVGRPGGDAVPDTLRVAAVALAALQTGAVAGALQHAAAVGLRQIGGHRALADGRVELDALRRTLWHAVADLERGDAAAAEVSTTVATWWRIRGGLDVAQRIQRLCAGPDHPVRHPVRHPVPRPVRRHLHWVRQLATTLA